MKLYGYDSEVKTVYESNVTLLPEGDIWLGNQTMLNIEGFRFRTFISSERVSFEHFPLVMKRDVFSALFNAGAGIVDFLNGFENVVRVIDEDEWSFDIDILPEHDVEILSTLARELYVVYKK